MEFERSRTLYQRACRTAPGAIHSNVRANWKPHPMFYERGDGSRMWDVDGNEFIDYVLARGPLLLGHSPKPVLDAVKAQLDRGLMFAGQLELEIEAAERVHRLVPCAEMVRFATSGSEAVHGALRLARGATNRPKILRFEGHYHGWFDSVFWNYAAPLDQAGPRDAVVPVPQSKGQAVGDAAHIVVRPWNDLDLVKDVFAEQGDRIAAVLCEPIMCNTGAIMPQSGYLEGLRDLCDEHGALLIFDEVITGFRVSLGGAQQLLGVTPDVATFAKGIAGGFPVSAIAGKEKYLQHFGDMTITHSGTYNSNGPCMAATVAALDTLAANDGAALKHASSLGDQLMKGITEAAKAAGKKVSIRGVPTVFHVTFNADDPIVDYRSFTTRDAAAYIRFFLALQERGVRVIPEGLWFVSTAHTQQDIDVTIQAIHEAIKVV